MSTNLIFYSPIQYVKHFVEEGIHKEVSQKIYEAINSDSIQLFDSKGQEIKITPTILERINNCVRLSLMSSHSIQLSKTFIAIEINTKILNFSDVFLLRYPNGRYEYLKNFMVHNSLIERIWVDSFESMKAVRQDIGDSKLSIEINPAFFNTNTYSTYADPIYSDNPTPKTNSPQENLIQIRRGNILNSQMQTIVNTVNCVGIMGKGIALAFKNKYPKMFLDYSQKCKRSEVKLGRPYCYRCDSEQIILNFPTKDHWRENSHLEDVKKGLAYLVCYAKNWGITSIAIPPLGCGNGNLNWHDVLPLIKEALTQLQIPAEIYEPY